MQELAPDYIENAVPEIIASSLIPEELYETANQITELSTSESQTIPLNKMTDDIKR